MAPADDWDEALGEELEGCAGSGTGNRRTADPVAIHLFDRLRLRSEVDRLHVYRALGPVWSSDSPAWRELALTGIGRCANDLGRRPAVSTYDAWRSAQERPEQWLTSRQIRTRFGSWPSAVQEAGLKPVADPLASKRRGVAGAFSEDELLDALRACAADLGGRPLTLQAYRDWVRKELRRPGAERTASRLPVAAAAFKRVFGTWTNAVAAAATVEPGPEALASAEAVIARPRRRRPRPASGQYSDDEVIGALRAWAATTSPGDSLTMTAYRAWARDGSEQCQGGPDGDEAVSRCVPIRETVFERFGGWPETLGAAGLARAETVARERCANPRDWGAAELTTAFALYLTECPGAASGAASGNGYMRWRKSRLREGPLPTCALPSIKPLRKAVSPSQCLEAARRGLEV